MIVRIRPVLLALRKPRIRANIDPPEGVARAAADRRKPAHFLAGTGIFRSWFNAYVRSIETSTSVPLLVTSKTGDSLLSAFNRSRFSASVSIENLTRMFW